MKKIPGAALDVMIVAAVLHIFVAGGPSFSWLLCFLLCLAEGMDAERLNSEVIVSVRERDKTCTRDLTTSQCIERLTCSAMIECARRGIDEKMMKQQVLLMCS
jgi:hypothetical protein